MARIVAADAVHSYEAPHAAAETVGAPLARAAAGARRLVGGVGGAAAGLLTAVPVGAVNGVGLEMLVRGLTGHHAGDLALWAPTVRGTMLVGGLAGAHAGAAAAAGRMRAARTATDALGGWAVAVVASYLGVLLGGAAGAALTAGHVLQHPGRGGAWAERCFADGVGRGAAVGALLAWAATAVGARAGGGAAALDAALDRLGPALPAAVAVTLLALATTWVPAAVGGAVAAVERAAWFVGTGTFLSLDDTHFTAAVSVGRAVVVGGCVAVGAWQLGRVRNPAARLRKR